MPKAYELSERHRCEKKLKHSHKRDHIIQTFLKTNRHVSAEELHSLVKKDYPEIGYTTVYRTLKLILNSGIAQSVDFDDGVRRYEPKIGREYHAHFICTECGINFEVFDQKIADLCSSLAKDRGFSPQEHRYEIFGICQNCKE